MRKQNQVQFSTWYEKKAKRKFTEEEQDSKSGENKKSGNSGKGISKSFDGKNKSRGIEKDFSSESRKRRDGNNGRHRKSDERFSSRGNERSRSLLVAKEIERLLDASSIPSDGKQILNDFQTIINSTHPLNSKQRSLMSEQIRDLSHSLTDQRGERRLGYMNQPSTLSAYVHYFLWWNLVRLTRLFANLPSDFLNLTEEDVCLDIGCGPLTVLLALYISRPELRSKKLKWYCMDISSQALSIGENLMMTISTKLGGELWDVIKVKGNFGTDIKERATFVSCANVFNEVIEDRQMPPDYQAKKCSVGILSYVSSKAENTRILLVEPGVPSSARLLSLMRASFIRKGYYPVSPCTHCRDCPMEGKKGEKWCNFAFSTEDAPAALKKISDKAYLQKERAVLSFVALKKGDILEEDLSKIVFRIASDPIYLPGNRTGYYACSRIGLLLVVTSANLSYGDCLSVESPKRELPVDEKSGAFILELD